MWKKIVLKAKHTIIRENTEQSRIYQLYFRMFVQATKINYLLKESLSESNLSLKI